MAKKIIVKVNAKDGVVIVKHGRFGTAHQFSGGWYTDHSINEVVEEFCKQSVAEYQRKIFKVVKK